MFGSSALTFVLAYDKMLANIRKGSVDLINCYVRIIYICRNVLIEGWITFRFGKKLPLRISQNWIQWSCFGLHL